MQIFQPNLTLILNPDGLYTLDSVTITPSSCYSAGRARRGAPPHLRFGPEVEPLMLDIKVRDGMCLQVITPVKHRVHSLQLGEGVGKTTITAFGLVDSRVVGQSSVSLAAGGVSVALSSKSLPIDTSDWYAWTNAAAGSLHVKGNLYVPTPGYAANLRLGEPTGAGSANNLVMDLEISEKPGNWPEIITCLTVTFEAKEYDPSHRRILVRWLSGSATLDIDRLD